MFDDPESIEARAEAIRAKAEQHAERRAVRADDAPPPEPGYLDALSRDEPAPRAAPRHEPLTMAEPAPDSVELIRGSDLRLEPVAWLWPGWLARGKLHILGGAPGTGKTTLAVALAAAVTAGGRFPDGHRAPVGNVVIWSGEDDPADTLAPRLIAAGADMNRVFFVGDVAAGGERRPFDPARDVEALAHKLDEIGGASLLIVDPIVSAVAADSHRNAEVRRGLQPLVDLAARASCALLGVTHFSKGTAGREPVERLTGSLAFGAVARVVMVAAKRRDDETEDGAPSRLFLRAKSNTGPDAGGFAYDLQQAQLSGHPGIVASCVAWGEAVEGSARELLATAEADDPDAGADGVASVAEWLRVLIDEEGGRADRRDVMRAGHAMGYAERTIHRAREKLGLIVQQSGFGKDKRSFWTWPIHANDPPILPCMPTKFTGTHGTNGTHGPVEVEI